MHIAKFRLADSDLDRIINHLTGNLSFKYRNSSPDMTILASEEFYFRNNSTQLNMVIAKKEGTSVFVDIIGGAGGSGIFNINLWSEKGYIKKVRKVLNKYVEERGIILEEL